MNLPDLDMVKLNACPICGSENIPMLFVTEDANRYVTYCKCEECGVMFLNPRVTDEQTIHYYQGAYRDGLPGTNGINGIDLARQRERAMFQTNTITKYLTGGRALEIGCSAGYLLEKFSGFGYECIGIEPDVRYHKLEPARKFEMHNYIGEVEPQPFDMIAMSHVLEHLNHPLEYLTTLRDYAHYGTLLMVEVPNTNAARFACIHHPYAFTPETLDMVLERACWERVMQMTHGLGRKSQFYILGLYKLHG